MANTRFPSQDGTGYVSPYDDIEYSRGPKVIYGEEDVFRVLLNDPQQDDDDEWGRTEQIALRQIIDESIRVRKELFGYTTGYDGLSEKWDYFETNHFSIDYTTASDSVLTIGNTVLSNGSLVLGSNTSLTPTQFQMNSNYFNMSKTNTYGMKAWAGDGSGGFGAGDVLIYWAPTESGGNDSDASLTVTVNNKSYVFKDTQFKFPPGAALTGVTSATFTTLEATNATVTGILTVGTSTMALSSASGVGLIQDTSTDSSISIKAKDLILQDNTGADEGSVTLKSYYTYVGNGTNPSVLLPLNKGSLGSLDEHRWTDLYSSNILLKYNASSGGSYVDFGNGYEISAYYESGGPTERLYFETGDIASQSNSKNMWWTPNSGLNLYTIKNLSTEGLYSYTRIRENSIYNQYADGSSINNYLWYYSGYFQLYDYSNNSEIILDTYDSVLNSALLELKDTSSIGYLTTITPYEFAIGTSSSYNKYIDIIYDDGSYIYLYNSSDSSAVDYSYLELSDNGIRCEWNRTAAITETFFIGIDYVQDLKVLGLHNEAGWSYKFDQVNLINWNSDSAHGGEINFWAQSSDTLPASYIASSYSSGTAENRLDIIAGTGGPATTAYLNLYSAGDVEVDASDNLYLYAGAIATLYSAASILIDADTTLTLTGDSGIGLTSSSGQVAITANTTIFLSSADIRMISLPSSAPTESGRLYYDPTDSNRVYYKT